MTVISVSRGLLAWTTYTAKLVSKPNKPEVVARVCNTTTQEADSRLNFETTLVDIKVLDQPGLHTEICLKHSPVDICVPLAGLKLTEISCLGMH